MDKYSNAKGQCAAKPAAIQREILRGNNKNRVPLGRRRMGVFLKLGLAFRLCARTRSELILTRSNPPKPVQTRFESESDPFH
jgi:hypothetical protein